jgi:hypothetical protein
LYYNCDFLIKKNQTISLHTSNIKIKLKIKKQRYRAKWATELSPTVCFSSSTTHHIFHAWDLIFKTPLA